VSHIKCFYININGVPLGRSKAKTEGVRARCCLRLRPAASQRASCMSVCGLSLSGAMGLYRHGPGKLAHSIRRC